MKKTKPLVLGGISLAILGAYTVATQYLDQAPKKTENQATYTVASAPIPTTSRMLLSGDSTGTGTSTRNMMAARTYHANTTSKAPLSSLSKEISSQTETVEAPMQVEEAPKVPTPDFAFANHNFTKSDGHWMNNLSGQDARIGVFNSRKDMECRGSENCGTKNTANEINITGIVVDSNKLEGPSEGMVEGKFARGSYSQNRPAVYLK